MIWGSLVRRYLTASFKTLEMFSILGPRNCINKNQVPLQWKHVLWTSYHHAKKTHCYLLQSNVKRKTMASQAVLQFSFINESASRPHETSESAHRNRIFFKPLSTVVESPVHTSRDSKDCSRMGPSLFTRVSPSRAPFSIISRICYFQAPANQTKYCKRSTDRWKPTRRIKTRI